MRVGSAALLLALLAAGTAPSPAAGQVAVQVVPDPVPVGDSLTVGDPLWTTVVTRGPAGWGLLPASLVDAYGEHDELAVLDTERRDGRLRLKIGLFRPGDRTLPEVDAKIVTGRGDTIAVPVVSDTIPVASVLAPGDTLLADIKPLWREEGIGAWVWAVVAAAALLALLAWLWRRRRGVEPAGAREPVDPYEAARERLEALREGDPPTSERRIAAARSVGEAVRGYLADGWGLPARERTTFELLAAPPAGVRKERAALGSVFSVVDRAKYARLAPATGEVPELAGRALQCLERLEGRRRGTKAGEEGAMVEERARATGGDTS